MEDTKSSIDCSFLDDYSPEELAQLKAEIDNRLTKKEEDEETVDVSSLVDDEEELDNI